MMRAISILLAVLLLLLSVGLGAAPARFTMYLKAHPQAIVADGRSETTISAEVRDPKNNPVPDGTVVNFTTSVGSIERSARTTAGVARVQLQSPAVVGTAIVSAVVENGGAVGQVRVDFLEPGTEMFNDSFITISSPNHLGYDVNERIVDAAGGVSIYSRGLSISAEEAQIDLKNNILRAKGKIGGDNIVLKRGNKQFEASALYYDFNAMFGVLIAPASEGAKKMTFRGRDLYVEPATEDSHQALSLDYLPVTEASMFIKARSMVIRPEEEIKFKKAVFYMDGSRMIKVPLYVVSLSGGTMSSGQMFSYSSDGLRLDVPFYYSLTPNSTGALRLRRGDAGSWGYYSDRPGWQLDLQQDYNYAGTTEGTFMLSRITSPDDWGARWTNRTQFANNSQIYSYLDFPSHRSLFGSMSYARGFKAWSLSVNTRASSLFTGSSAIATTKSLASDIYLQTRSRPALGGAFNYSFNTKFSVDVRDWKDVRDQDAPRQTLQQFGSGIGLQLYSRPAKLGALGMLNTSLGASQNFGMRAGPSITGTAGLTKSFGHIGSAGLNYSYTFYKQRRQEQQLIMNPLLDPNFSYSGHQLSFNLMLNPNQKWSAFANATMSLSENTFNTFASIDYLLAPTWRLQVLGNYWTGATPDNQFALAKAIGRQEFSLIWSTAEQRMRFEFSPLRY